MDDDYTEPESAEILLELQAAVNGQQNIELLLSQLEKRAILQCAPALFVNCSGIMIVKQTA